MKTTKILITLCLLMAWGVSKAASVDTALTYSAAMKRNIKAVVVKPEGYSKDQKYPSLYLLHGFSGDQTDWIKKVPAIQDLADQYKVIIVCPYGAFAGWYVDSPELKDFQYETYITNELVAYIDKNYSTIKDRNSRAITGLSMGGFGGLSLGIKHQDVFGAAGSMSGAVDLRPLSDAFGIEQVLGKYAKYPERWEKASVENLIYLLKPKSLAIIFDCGNDDFLYRFNVILHDKLLERNIPHEFTVRPGSHTWEYWANSITYQMLFFSRFFKGQMPK
ncbi:alpha/beta hydrolase [Mucilaginibacter myungsuensis]|uniref:Esterase family protein n=1 Tax=Mucilaginibacter myungsuensis TaxID=649104 RepID=A0A929KYV6_9SPHI|nr:alpha/beta hydrolase family protein [Mucilaginibacter myungsuensis]MBE9663702.1 esterase family protein [Mucilaginibacter myungsuensis]MDN3598974.1 alpha/beta hydrolase family protein [Mucilaginibacter myungsuensis]